MLKNNYLSVWEEPDDNSFLIQFPELWDSVFALISPNPALVASRTGYKSHILFLALPELNGGDFWTYHAHSWSWKDHHIEPERKSF